MADPIKDAESGKLAPIYIVVSEQPILMERVVKAIRGAAVDEAMAAFNYDVVEGKGATAGQILGMVQTLPMMAKRRMIYLRNINKMVAAELKALIPYVEDPNPSTVLLCTAEKIDKRIKFFQRVKKAGFLHELNAPKNLGNWVSTEAKRRHVKIEAGATRRLADAIGKDLARLSIAVEQLALYAGDRPVSVDDVEDLIADTRERSVFELTDAIGDANLQRAMVAISSLCEQRQSAVGVVIMLARHMRQIAKCHAAKEAKIGRGELARYIGVPPFIVDKLLRQYRSYDRAAVQQALVHIGAVDGALKGRTQLTKTLGSDLGERVLLGGLVRDIIATAQ